MHSLFETAPTAAAIPITFATKATWAAISKELTEPARQFALANDLAAVEGLATTGLVRRTAADTWSAGTLVGLRDLRRGLVLELNLRDGKFLRI